MARTLIITATHKVDEEKKEKAFQYMNNNLSVQEILRLEEMARSKKARGMLNENWAMLQSFI